MGRELSELATRQHGVASVRQLERLGYSRNAIARAVDAGRLTRLHRGVYAVGHLSLTSHSHCLAAVLACAPNALLSHASAAWLWGLVPNCPGTIDVSAPNKRRAKSTIRLHSARLVDAERTIREGVPVTSVPRVLLDVAGAFPASRLDRVIERSEELQRFDLRQVEAVLGRVRRHPGVGPLKRALAIYREEPAFTRSRLERRFLALLRKAGLPTPATNYVLGGYELDVTRVTGPRLDREPEVVMQRVATLLGQRRRGLN